jgi:hypothetical protein
MLFFRLGTIALLIVLVVIVGGRGTPLLRVGNGGTTATAGQAALSRSAIRIFARPNGAFGRTGTSMPLRPSRRALPAPGIGRMPVRGRRASLARSSVRGSCHRGSVRRVVEDARIRHRVSIVGVRQDRHFD